MILKEFLWMSEVSIKASIIVLFVLTLKWTIGRKMTAGWHYCVWIIVIPVLILPMIPFANSEMVQKLAVLPNIDIQSYSYAQFDYKATAEIQEKVLKRLNEVSFQPVLSQTIPQVPMKDTKQYQWAVSFQKIMTYLSIIWLCGLVLHIGYRLVVVGCFSYKLRRQKTVMHMEMQRKIKECAEQIQLHQVPVAYSTRLVILPAIYGVFHPKLLIPVGFEEKINAEEMKLIMIHELLHVKRKDILVNIIMTLIQCLHWFNPILLFAFRQIQSDREMACDEMVLKLSKNNDQYHYGSLILKLIMQGNKRVPMSVAGMSIYKHSMKRRIYMITQFNRKRRYMKFVATVTISLAVVFAAVFALNNKSLASEDEQVIGVESQDGIIIHPGQIMVDGINLPFVEDPEVLGKWESVDFVATIDSFDPVYRYYPDELYLTELVFLEDGELKVNDDQDRPWFKWTNGVVTHSGDNTASKYLIEEIDGSTYMFFEWKSGDYSMRGMDPHYYVLKKVE
ncbi:MAG: hypothetical protein H7X94_15270 [Vallitaleaceae bacterium]|nr:hypothetical protein [Vallitaleaceae bacterium]